ncbi:MAG TPA: MFS transporter [Anaerolineales bacterium]|nr:MFS transporter [Anaerolineales bacterium]
MTPTRPGGIRTFRIVWAGQFASLMGTSLTRFALLVWAYQQSGSATTLALLGFFSFITLVIVSPFAGVLVDRFDRRRVMILGDLGAGLMTIALLLLYTMGGLQIWHLYLAEGLAGMFEAFQNSAYSSAISVLVPRQEYARAAGMRSLASWAGQLIAPVLAGLLLRLIHLQGVMLIDVVTVSIAMLTLLIVRFPRPEISAIGMAARGTFWHELRFGFRYVAGHKGLLHLLMIFGGHNLVSGLTYCGTLPAMILARTGGDEVALGVVQGALGLGGVIGGTLVSANIAPRRKIHAVLGLTALSFLFGDLLFGIGRSIPVWVIAGMSGAVFSPFIASANAAIWQSKVPPDVQGRVLSIKDMLQPATMPFGYLFGGLLADRVFEPLMSADGQLAGAFGWLVGTGPGAGMGLMFICTCTLGTLIALSGYLIRDVREIEDDRTMAGIDSAVR